MSKHNFGLAAAPTPRAFEPWHLHTGSVQLFIVGPGPDAWLACSESYYSGQIGSDEGREIALRCVTILNHEQCQNKDAGADEIRAALERARRLFSVACAS